MRENGGVNWVPAGIVLATGVVLGLFFWNTYFAKRPHLYPVEFKEANWIAASDDAPQGYFRKEIYIPGSVRQAWIMVAASDSFTLFLNGRAIDARGYASINVSGMYDIGSLLHPGKNVLGVAVRRLSYPGAARMVAEGAYLDEAGQSHPLLSDASWQVSLTEQRRGEVPWHAESFDAVSWGSGKEGGRPDRSEIYPLDVSPLAVTLRSQGKWIRPPNALQSQATYSYTLTLPSKTEEAWIRIASDSPYLFSLNGVALAGEAAESELPRMKLPGVEIREIQDRRGTTDLYNMTPFLRPGANRIALSYQQRVSPILPGLFVDGFVVADGAVSTFGADTTWHVTSSSEPLEAVILASDVPLPAKRMISAILPFSETARRMVKMAALFLLTTALLYFLWQASARCFCRLHGGDLEAAKEADALAHLPVLIFLIALFLLRFDVRFDPAAPFREGVVWFSVAALLVFKAAVIATGSRTKVEAQPAPAGKVSIDSRIVYTALFLSLIAVGAFLRLRGLDTQSLYHDEIHMMVSVEGFFKSGYPHKTVGSIERPLATYELLPYPIALSAKLFGPSEFAVRLPAALFGIGTIALIYFVGGKVFDRRVGLLAAAVYTFCPQALIWAKYLWHPQQTQFFALLTSYLFYRAAVSSPMSPRSLYAAAGAFIATYLSWEGSGFLLPALGLGLLAVKGKDRSWMKEKHLWIAVGGVAMVVVAQLTRRILFQYQYLVVGKGLSDVGLPTLFFLDPMYNPTFYIRSFLWLDNNALLTLLLTAGLPFLFAQAGFAYYATLLLSTLFMMTNLLSHAAIRYTYYLQPFLILSASAVAVAAVGRVQEMVRRELSPSLRPIGGTTAAAFMAVFLLGSSFFMKLYRLTDFVNPSGIHTRPDIYSIDYRTPAQYLQSRAEEGDLVITVIPDTLRYYSDIEGQYFVESYAKRQVFYDPAGSSPFYLETIEGKPVLRNLEELRDVLHRYRKTWFVAVPYVSFYYLSGQEIMKYVEERGKVVYESYSARVYLLES
jgi:hypothetical protein